MSILNRYETDLNGSWDQSGPTFTQPDVQELPKGVGTVSFTFRSTCSNYNSGSFTAQLQATTEGSNASPPDGTKQWDVLASSTLAADGAIINKGGQGIGVDLSSYKFVRVIYSVTGSPSADATFEGRLVGDYVT